MGKKISTQINTGIYPNKEDFYNYYIVQNHSIGEVSTHYNLSKNIIINLINFFNLHKQAENAHKNSSKSKIINNCYPERETLIYEYKKIGSWEGVRKKYNIPKSTFLRLRYRLNIEKYKPNQILSSKDKIVELLKSYDHRPTGSELAFDLNVGENMVYYWIEKFGLSNMLNRYGSSYERILSEFFPDFKKNRTVIKPYELDFFNEEKNLAFEFNGDYWHSSEFKDKFYHFKKVSMCENAGIRLINIYEHEFKENRESILQYLIDFSSSIKSVEEQEYKCVINCNFENCYCVSTISLIDNKEINKMIFKKIKNDEWELVEYHPELSYKIYNSNKRMFELFTHSVIPESITYTCDLDKDNGKELMDLGMRIIEVLEPQKIEYNNNFIYNAGSRILLYSR